ncbi:MULTISPECIES: hypothetical protein [unclassified Methylobacterium]|uniref:hypothetical protein n=1 Tax=unclassified Methylobacterium TaxID=2615210 RepID=UPI00226AC278
MLYPDLTPRSSPLPHLNHQHLGETFSRKPEDRRELLSKLDAALADTAADVVLLSYESFCLPPHRTAAPKLLCDLLARRGFRLEILMTVRPQASYILSQYTWRIQFLREARPFRVAFLKDLAEHRYDYLHGLGTWARAADWRVHAVPLQDVRSTAPLAARIAAELGLAGRLMPLLTSADLAFRTNQSFGPVATEVSRRLRRLGVTYDLLRSRAITGRIETLTQECGLDAEPFQGLDEAMLRKASRRFVEQNEGFAQRVWGEAWARRVRPEHLGPVNELAGRDLDVARATEVERIKQVIVGEFELRPPSSLRRVWHNLSQGAPTWLRSSPLLRRI